MQFSKFLWKLIHYSHWIFLSQVVLKNIYIIFYIFRYVYVYVPEDTSISKPYYVDVFELELFGQLAPIATTPTVTTIPTATTTPTFATVSTTTGTITVTSHENWGGSNHKPSQCLYSTVCPVSHQIKLQSSALQFLCGGNLSLTLDSSRTGPIILKPHRWIWWNLQYISEIIQGSIKYLDPWILGYHMG